MITWQVIGDYLERKIQLAVCAELNCHIRRLSFKNSVVMVVFTTSAMEEPSLRRLLLSLLDAAPLALAVYGQGAPLVFNDVISVLSGETSDPHIMTYLISEENPLDAMREFLYAIWPSEERFDQWETYSIVCFDSKDAALIVHSLEALLSKIAH